ncbi:MAG: redoxin domain-containing protein [Candidatus Marinimicrobia bacterium]|nr:redoxin domain-containing protein [Candidatus Neomarinimicrobiota bacterium]MDP6835844.1 redoxin domain-containing protein [Candidatus Neomarinimicrobiota bacterium]
MADSVVQNEHEYSSIRISSHPAIKELINFPVTTPQGAKTGVLDKYEKSGYPDVLIISFMAAWCKNCHYEAPYVESIYREWHDRGLEMTMVAEYSPKDKWRDGFVKKHHLTIPYVYGEIPAKVKALRETTTHYRLRKLLDDKRGWGTPFHILIVCGNKDSVYFVTGEFMVEELEKFLSENLRSPHSGDR